MRPCSVLNIRRCVEVDCAFKHTRLVAALLFHHVGGALLGFALCSSTPPSLCVAEWQSFFSAIWRLYPISKVLPVHGLTSLFAWPLMGTKHLRRPG